MSQNAQFSEVLIDLHIRFAFQAFTSLLVYISVSPFGQTHFCSRQVLSMHASWVYMNKRIKYTKLNWVSSRLLLICLLNKFVLLLNLKERKKIRRIAVHRFLLSLLVPEL